MIRMTYFSIGHKSLRALLPAVLVTAFLAGTAGFSSQAEAQREQREPPPTRSSEVLSDRVYRQIAEIAELMSPEDERDQPNLPRAKERLDALNERYDSLNDFEKSTLLNFYTNYYLEVEDMENTMRTFERILQIENLRLEIRLRALMALAQIYMGDERYQDSINMLNQWRELSEEENERVFLLLANAYYTLEDYNQAIPFLIQHMDMVEAAGNPAPRNIWNMLFSMYVEQENFEEALKVARQMVVRFDEPADWTNLAAVYSTLDNDALRIHTMALAYSKGYFSNEGQFTNLAQSLAGVDAPYQGAKVMMDGIAQGIVEETGQNLERLTQMLLMANEYEMALEPARQAAEMAEDGNAYDYLGYIYFMVHDYENAAEAIKSAIQRGGLDNPEDTHYFLARALLEIEDFAGAAEAAREAQRLGNDNARQYLTHIENQRRRRATLDEQKAAAIDFYRS